MTIHPPVTEELTSDRALSFWPTPADVADDLVYWLMEPWHGLGDGVRALEPSAGEGHLVHAIRHHLPEAHITAVEPSATRAVTLRALAGIDVVESTLEAYLADITVRALSGRWEPFHLAVMNPPFTLAGRPEAWAEHVLAIYHDPYLLAPGGVIGAVVPRIVMTGRSKRVRQVRALLADCGGVKACERGAFASVGAKVSTALMWAQKPFDLSGAINVTDPSDGDES
uniref:hypothetical protein n=1 Tax=Nonomuraea sp. CA-251285 TaxID=3240002 RepID=UPI003F490CBA